MNILFVCTGNTCRSPMAEFVLKSKSDTIKVESAGIYASFASPISDGTKQVLDEAEIKFNHQSKLITKELIDWANLVLTMTHEHKQLLNQMFPSIKGKVFTLKEYNIKYKERASSRYFDALERLKAKQRKFKEPKEELESELERELAITKFVKEELEEVEAIRWELIAEDIQDPFGKSIAAYQATYNELTKEIKKIINEVDNDESNHNR